MEIKGKISLRLPSASYDITVGRGLLSHAGEFFNLNRRVLIVTDSGVPLEYARAVAKSCKEYRIHTFTEGECNKTLATYEGILRAMHEFGMHRDDCVVAVGGGVCGDMSGFAAGTYMRGIDFYNVPTTLLSQVDSSVGGKCAVDFMGTKNIVGVFHQPKGVLIDTDTLRTLDKRQVSAGFAEIIKMAATSDSELFSMLEAYGENSELECIILRAVNIKRSVVEADEKESGLRRVLNFGHTYGHAVEATSDYLHGECVAIGMLPMASEGARVRIAELLKKFSLPTQAPMAEGDAFEFMKHDKKCDGDKIAAVFVDEIGSFRIEKISIDSLISHIKAGN